MKSSRATAKPRRSARSSILANLPSHEPDPNDSVRVTPSPTETDPDSSDNAKPKKRKSATSKEKKATSPYFDKASSKSSSGEKLELASGSDDAEEVDSDAPLASATKRKRTSKSGSGTANEVDVKTKAASAKKRNKNTGDDGPVETVQEKVKPAKKAAAKKKNTNNNSDATNNDNSIMPSGGEPDGNGGLNQPAPYNVEYSKSSRATCRTCDEIIKKGDVRVGHTPLFRGKPGYMVFRHLQCVVFSENITCAEDVENYDSLKDEDYERLAEQVEVSKAKIKEEMEELEPDELVQKSFEGEIRAEPPGLTANLLPFQVEGFSWMRHQEVKCPEIRGGILADEMGMGKTLQTIATIMDNRPKLQHCKPGTKHPLSDDLKERQEEDLKWEKAAEDWNFEMDILKVVKKIRSRDGGARAGTLVVCPVIALTQWKTEIEKFTDGSLIICTYHGPDRESQTPREMLKKYDVVLTTYQVVEADFRKMTSPNRVECPNCGGKFKLDKLPIHLKYFCGESAQKTEAQARQRRGDGEARGRRGRRPDRPFGKSDGKDKPTNDTKCTKKDTKSISKSKESAAAKTASKTKPSKPITKKSSGKKKSSKSDTADYGTTATSRRSSRGAAQKAANQITKSAAEWVAPDGDDSDSEVFKSESSSSDEESEAPDVSSDSSESDSDSSTLKRARAKQQQALERARKNKGKKPAVKGGKKEPTVSKKGEKKSFTKKGKKKFDDDYEDSSSSDESDDGDEAANDIDMDALVQAAMEGAKNSVLHSLCWWRIVLDEAHFIKTRSSQTANAAFSLIGIHRWCLSGTPLQNRVGEFYSLVRFLRLDPMAFYYCRTKGCDCKNMHYRITAGVCEDCGHGGVQHFSHFNKYVLNPIQREGYTGDGRRAMFVLKNEVLDTCLLRRTKETKASDMELPPRLVEIKPIRLHPVEEDFYSALYTQTKSSFNDYVDSGTLLNNYAHIFDLLIRMRQSVDHPYLVIYSNKNTDNGRSTPSGVAGVDCDLCHEPPTSRVVSTCCGAAYCRSCVLEYMSGTTSLANSDSLSCPSCRGDFSIDLETSAEVEDDSVLALGTPTRLTKHGGEFMPSLKELPHVATGSILRRINLADFATSSKIEALTQELVQMRQKSPGSKAIVFSQFVNMLDLIRWRLHSDPYLEDIGLGARALHGGMNVKARDAVLKEFREDNNVRVLLMSLKAGGVALNLTCANHIYLMDPWWNPAAEMQAIDRTHRLGQYRPIRAVRFIAENTVEERILQLQEKKRLVFDGTVGRDAGSLKMLTVDDMKSLFA
ncbi:hypothetical protein ACHAXN_006958 [Cyclotella atomus]